MRVRVRLNGGVSLEWLVSIGAMEICCRGEDFVERGAIGEVWIEEMVMVGLEDALCGWGAGGDGVYIAAGR